MEDRSAARVQAAGAHHELAGVAAGAVGSGDQGEEAVGGHGQAGEAAGAGDAAVG